jgi:hypothetical protein
VGAVLASAPAPEVLAPALQRGHFRPTEEESLLDWFAHFLTVRNGLWEVVEEVSRPVGGRIEDLLDLALAGEGFDPVAVCGSPGCPPGLTVAPDAAAAIWASYR